MAAPLKSYIDRVLNVLSEIDDLGTDKKNIYKELADEGYDRTVVAQVVGHIRKKAKKPGKFAEQSALFDLYLADYEGTGTVVATHTPHASSEDFDPETGEILDTTPPASQETTAADPAGEADDASSTDQSTAARSDVLGDEGKAGVSPAPDRTLAELEVAPPAGDQAEPGAGDATADAAPPVDTKSQEHPELGSDVLRDSLAGVEGDADRQPIHQSTAPRSDVGDNSTEASGPGQRLDPAAATTPPAGETPPVDTVLLQEGDVEAEGQGRVTREQGSGEPSQPLLPNGRVENKPDGPAVTVAAPISATHHGGSGAIPETAAAPVAEGVSHNASSVTPFLAITAGGRVIRHQGEVA
jgi:uncharacterized protein (UPF0335 family)